MMNLLVGLLALALAQSAPRGVTVAGLVQDQTGAVLAGALVTLSGSDPATGTQEATADQSGQFRFERVSPGEYDVRAEFPGFTQRATHVRVGTRASSPLTMVLPIEGLTQEVAVSGGGTETSTAAE